MVVLNFVEENGNKVVVELNVEVVFVSDAGVLADENAVTLLVLDVAEELVDFGAADVI